MKKLISAILCLLMVGALALPAMATGDFTVEISKDIEAAEVGDEVTFTVSLDGTPSSRSGSLEVTCGEGIEIISGEMTLSGATIASYDLSKNKGVAMVSTAKSFDGVFATVTAKVTEADAATREVTFAVKLNPSGDESSAVGSVAMKTEGATASVGSAEAKPGGSVTLDVVLAHSPAIKSLAASDITFDSEALTLTGFEWTLNGSILSSFDEATGKGVAAFRQDTDINGAIISLTFDVKSGAAPGEYPISVTVSAKSSSEPAIEITTVPGSITVGAANRPGDVNSDGSINAHDLAALKLALAGVYGTGGVTVETCDVNRDGHVNAYDVAAIKLILAA